MTKGVTLTCLLAGLGMLLPVLVHAQDAGGALGGGEIVDLETSNLNGFSAAVTRWNGSGGLTAGELNFVGQAYSNLGQLGLQEVTELQDLLTPGKVTMTDDGRMARIPALDGEVREQYVFVVGFVARMDGLVEERMAEAGGAGVIRRVYGGEVVSGDARSVWGAVAPAC